MNKFFRATPLLIFPAILYAVLAIVMGEAGLRPFLLADAFSAILPSGAEWVVTRGHALIMFAVACLFFEVLKSTRPTGASIVDTVLAFLAFTLFLVLFLLVRTFGTIEFFLIIIMTLLDFLTGAIVMIYMARRDIAMSH